LAAAEVAFKTKYYPDEELCDWSIGELIPHPEEVDGQVVWHPPGAEWAEAAGLAPGTRPPDQMFRDYMCVANNALIGGATSGRLAYQDMCRRGFLPMCLGRFSKATLAWPSSQVIYKISPQLGRFMKDWRANWHRPNIAFADRQKYYAGFTRKVVRCADIPEKLLKVPGKIATDYKVSPHFILESSMEFATRTWLGMESLLTVSNLTASFTGPADWSPGPVEQIVKPNLTITRFAAQVKVTISGMDGKWFGIGFDASRMSDHPHTVIVDGHGAVSERKLATYLGGEALGLQFKDISHSVVNGIRTVVLTRDAESSDPGRFSFPLSGKRVRYIWSVGITSAFSTHEESGPASVVVSADQGVDAIYA